MHTIEIYCDGSCWPNPGPNGSWGAVVMRNGTAREYSGRIRGRSTNQRAELIACIEALDTLDTPSAVRVYSDSKYVVGCVNALTSSKAKVRRSILTPKRANHDLIIELDHVVSRHAVEPVWIKGHSGIPGNERADQLAALAA